MTLHGELYCHPDVLLYILLGRTCPNYPILLCVLRRLYPLGPLIGKKLSEEIVAGGCRIPKGTLKKRKAIVNSLCIYTLGTSIGLGIYVMHHDPSVWSDPEVANIICIVIIVNDLSTEI